MSSQPLFIIDAFTDEPFRGNPAAVCLLERRMPEAWMQSVAAEMNLSETAFVRPHDMGFGLQWFTPECEVELCGHATLAATRALLEAGVAEKDGRVTYATRSGLLHAWFEGDWIVIDLPADRGEAIPTPPELVDALGVEPVLVQKHRHAYLAEMEDEAAILSMNPNFSALKAMPVDEFFITARASRPGCDFVSRMFAPALGIDEDPVTGAAHCAFGPYWQNKLNKTEMVGYQASQRGGTVRVKSVGERVQLSGRSTLMLRGQFLALPEDTEPIGSL